jgi:hypothetical protein
LRSARCHAAVTSYENPNAVRIPRPVRDARRGPGGPARRRLIDADDVAIGQQPLGLIVEHREIRADDERTARHGPEAELRALLGRRQRVCPSEG